ncbi:hypothetical protein N431DRAFT_460424 [Stipitochalara longipes BDJ]|nr:hypothetical protein N431DRAFT_460424 [Stipitochalara longipes BDJ]
MPYDRGRGSSLARSFWSMALVLVDVFESGDGDQWSPFDDGNGRRHLARQIQDVSPVSTPSQNVRLPVKAAPYFAALRAAVVPTFENPRGWTEVGEKMNGCQALNSEHSESIPCQSPFCTRGNGDPGSYMHHIGYEGMILQPYDQENPLIGCWFWRRMICCSTWRQKLNRKPPLSTAYWLVV